MQQKRVFDHEQSARLIREIRANLISLASMAGNSYGVTSRHCLGFEKMKDMLVGIKSGLDERWFVEELGKTGEKPNIDDTPYYGKF